VVVARPADHEVVKKALEEMSKPKPDEKPQEPKPAEPAPKPAEKPADSPAPDSTSRCGEPWRAYAEMQLGSPTEADQAGAEEKPAKPTPPVYVVLGEGSVTIVSDDPEALDQFEQLLRTLLPRTGQVGRDISIFELKHSSAAVVAEKLRELFRTSPFSWRRGGGSVVIVPDERLNTILVQGHRIDRETVEGLLKVLDSGEVPEALAADKPNLVPIKNVDANEIAQVVRDVFKSQLSPPGKGSSGQVSSLMTPQVAVDEATNSLVVMAASPLLEEIIQLATKLDEAAGENPARRVKIIPLQKTDASRVQRALEQILTPSPRRRR